MVDGLQTESESETHFMGLALSLARRAYGQTSPNPMVGAVLVKNGKIIGQGWHRRAGKPHAEIEALRDAQNKANDPKDATLYVTLEPCSTRGRTPPCTDAIVVAGIRRVVAAAPDPNPLHAGRAFGILRCAGIGVTHSVLAKEAMRLNEAFNHWIVHRTPFVTVKTAMTLDGKIATAAGKSKWITGEKARAYAMKLRMGADAILVGINTVLADDPALTVRQGQGSRSKIRRRQPRRVILDALARTPLTARIISDDQAAQTTIVVSWLAPRKRVVALSRFVNVWVAPSHDGKIDLRWLLPKLGADSVTGLLVEGGGEVNASFLEQRLVQRIAFFYAPMILGGHNARKAVAGAGAQRLSDAIELRDVEWRTLGPDLLLTALVR